MTLEPMLCSHLMLMPVTQPLGRNLLSKSFERKKKSFDSCSGLPVGRLSLVLKEGTEQTKESGRIETLPFLKNKTFF